MSRTLRTYVTMLATVMATGLAVVSTTSPAQAKTDNQGCPGGHTTYATSYLVGQGYSSDFLALVDANQDGIVCAKPFSAQQQARFCGSIGGCDVVVVFAFRDNYRGAGF